jgi:hypothetical protein
MSISKYIKEYLKESGITREQIIPIFNKKIKDLEVMLKDYKTDQNKTKDMTSKEVQRYENLFVYSDFKENVNLIKNTIVRLIELGKLPKNSIQKWNKMFKGVKTTSITGDTEKELNDTISFLKDIIKKVK